MKKPLVSVIIPTYNRSSMLKNSIESVLKQTYHNFELIIVDDGSTDNTKEVVKKIKDKRIKYFYKKNQGPASAQNYGIKHSGGKYITILGDDDLYLPNKIDVQVELLEKNSDYGFCYSNIYLKNKDKLHLYLSNEPFNSHLNLLLSKNFIAAPTVMIKSNTLKSLKGFNESYEIAEDYDLWLRAAKKYLFDYINKPLVIVNLHDSNLCRDIKKVSYYDGIVRYKHLKHYKGRIPKKYIKKYRRELAFQKGKVLFYEGKKTKARRYFKKAIKIDPTQVKAYLLYLSSYMQSTSFLDILFQLHLKIEILRYKEK
ncbi:hypothetical protein A2Z22_00255 [Candidatus Woesebacteria bacterium RBG_16_34_12]|uniref:Glycosyltransferase 2-like domain-containing protein n=1 Tax=Candidatus Woesebacteria bacterium RBG_16_34_12 TaxID=1802480 RepID=A0A1F7XAQ3_9BACT|nr:MAG: hypothetical protein A2Z22_00255 [Candidatus Woesebacteria bacterium RBG_16_34_12]